MTAVERLADFAVSASYEELSETARQQLKIRILDALGCAIGAWMASPLQMIRKNIAEFDANGKCTLLAGGRASPEHAAFYNGAAVRYLDFNDSYLAKGRNLPSQRQSGPNSGGGGVCGRQRPGVDDGPRCRLPGAVPIERCRRRPRGRVRSHCTGSLCRCSRSRTGVGSRCLQGRQRNRHQRHRLECTPRDAHRKAFALERPRLSSYGCLLHRHRLPGSAGHHWSAGSD